ncbi:MAG: Nif3-like dinuclear metal center hexameric protein, partial [Campylobacteraceae bacterium]|nr:Nif3-like dinuclear metal center hexameric protein [Campylobacteraceae bacterium]
MKLKKIYDFLNEISPFDTQESWDNSGLQVGSLEDEIENICLCLDVDAALLETLSPGTLVVSHHPLIFKGIKSLNTKLYPTNLITTMVKKDISMIAMHTNADKSHLNRYVCEKVLGWEVLKQEDFVCTCAFKGSIEDLVLHLKKRLNMQALRVSNAEVNIEKVAVTTGSGGSLLENIEAQCFLTGDIKYHTAMEAISNGLSLIDIGHFE